MHLEKMPYLPHFLYHNNDDKTQMFSTAATWTPDSHLGIRTSVSLGIGVSKHYRHQSQQLPL